MPNDAQVHVKQELLYPNLTPQRNTNQESTCPVSVIDLLSSDSDSDSSSSDDNGFSNNESKKEKKRRRAEDLDALLPLGFLDPLPFKQTPLPLPLPPATNEQLPLALPSPIVNAVAGSGTKQFWKAGDYEVAPSSVWDSSNGGMDHVRVHPRFLHSNATSHKWVLGAFAELLDNALDEVCNGATYANIDMAKSKKDGGKMLMIEDDGGGMDPDKMRHCMSLGYSAKSKIVDTIGQYGNGFKTSTMRLGADVIVFSRCQGKNGRRSTQSIGLLSYTFLRSTGKEDIVVPMLDYERSGKAWNRMVRSSTTDWNHNVETIVQWSPFSSEDDLLRQFNQMKGQGTRIIIYNLWEDDEGLLELDFDTDEHDIQIRGVNRDEKSIDMAKMYPNSRHFLTYRHSLRNYAAILYLRLPPSFRIILRGKDVEHHNIVNDMMMSQEIIYRPQPGGDGLQKSSNMVAIVTVGFVKDARAHIDVQGFNVYHKNRLIKPFWRIWHAPGSDGRGVIGVLEANFVEPAHDKQGFERTTVLSRLEARLVQMQKTYWSKNCHKIGYARRCGKKDNEREFSPDSFPQSPQPKKRNVSSDKAPTKMAGKGSNEGHLNGKGEVRKPRKMEEGFIPNEFSPSGSTSKALAQLKEENLQLRDKLKRKEEEILGELQHDFHKEKERSKSLEAQLQEAKQKYEEISKEQESLIDIFSEERQRRDVEEEQLRKKLKEASNTIEQLLDRLRRLEKASSNGK